MTVKNKTHTEFSGCGVIVAVLPLELANDTFDTGRENVTSYFLQ